MNSSRRGGAQPAPAMPPPPGPGPRPRFRLPGAPRPWPRPPSHAPRSRPWSRLCPRPRPRSRPWPRPPLPKAEGGFSFEHIYILLLILFFFFYMKRSDAGKKKNNTGGRGCDNANFWMRRLGGHRAGPPSRHSASEGWGHKIQSPSWAKRGDRKGQHKVRSASKIPPPLPHRYTHKAGERGHGEETTPHHTLPQAAHQALHLIRVQRDMPSRDTAFEAKHT